MKKFFIILIILALGGGGVAYVLKRNAAKELAASESPMAAKTLKAELGTIDLRVATTGKIVSNLDVEIKSKASGQIVHLPFDVSDEVTSGELLAELDPVDENKNVTQREVSLSSAKARLAQAVEQYQISLISLETETTSAQAELGAARIRNDEAHSKLVRQRDLFEVWSIARAHGLATANIGLLTDMICCPGGDLCALANARSVPIALAVQEKFDNLDYLHDLGEISLNISGCMNSCGHHHVANIGVLGVDKNNEEWYQITVGGQQGNAATIGKVIGPSFSAEEVPDVVEALVSVYLEQRTPEERFIDTFQRLGIEPFKERAYRGRDRRKPAASEEGAAHD